MKKKLSLFCFVLMAGVIIGQVSKSLNERPASGIDNAVGFGINVNSHLSVFKNFKALIVTKKSVQVAQTTVSKLVTITAGGLTTALTANEKTNVTNLTIVGSLDARDFKIMRDSMPGLSVLDISTATIVAYIGSGGTGFNSTYLANEIPEYAFFRSGETINLNTTLNSIFLPTSITSIGSAAFAFCTAMNSVNISSTILSIGNYAFAGCGAIIYVDASNPNYSSIDGALFDKNKTTLIQFPASKTGSYTIPTFISRINDYAFCYCTNLNSITIPSSVSNIGGAAFYNCTGLTSIYVNTSPVNFGSINNGVFMYVNFANCTLYVPYGAKVLYAAALQWSDFTNIVESSQGFIVGANTAKIDATNGSNTTIDVKANVSWSAVSDQSWLIVNPGSGSGNGLLTLTAQANLSETLRTATVTVSSSGYSQQIINVTQNVFAKSITVTAGGLSKILTPVGLNT